MLPYDLQAGIQIRTLYTGSLLQQAVEGPFPPPVSLGEWGVRDDCRLAHRMLKNAVRQGRNI